MRFQSMPRLGILLLTALTGCHAATSPTPTTLDSAPTQPTYQADSPSSNASQPAIPSRFSTTQSTSASRIRHVALHGGDAPAYEEGDFTLRKAPLREAFATVAAQAHNNWSVVEIEAEWDALAQVAITPETPVTVSIWSPTVEKALNAILNSLTVRKDSHLVFFVDGVSRIHVTTRGRHVWRDGLTHEYNVRSLLIETVEVGDDEVQIEARTIPTGLFGNAAHEDNPRRAANTRRDRLQAIVQLIKDTVDSDSWKIHDACWIGVDGDRLIIRQTEENHRAIVNLFEQLHETRWSNPLTVRVRPTTQSSTKPGR